jgi:hypothetical protein
MDGLGKLVDGINHEGCPSRHDRSTVRKGKETEKEIACPVRRTSNTCAPMRNSESKTHASNHRY